MERRDFIKTGCATCLGGLGMLWLMQACTTNKYITNVTIKENKLNVKKSEFTVIKKDKTVQIKFILIKPENLEFPIVVYKKNENEYTALFLKCTHQGCELSAHETMMVCPCHGAEFNTKGEVSQGPAEINLKTFSTTTDKENIYIQL